MIVKCTIVILQVEGGMIWHSGRKSHLFCGQVTRGGMRRTLSEVRVLQFERFVSEVVETGAIFGHHMVRREFHHLQAVTSILLDSWCFAANKGARQN